MAKNNLTEKDEDKIIVTNELSFYLRGDFDCCFGLVYHLFSWIVALYVMGGDFSPINA